MAIFSAPAKAAGHRLCGMQKVLARTNDSVKIQNETAVHNRVGSIMRDRETCKVINILLTCLESNSALVSFAQSGVNLTFKGTAGLLKTP